MFVAIAALTAVEAQPPRVVFATLQVPGAATGYVSAALKTGSEDTAGFFVVTDEVLRLGNVSYKLEAAPAKESNANVYSLRDPNGRFIICCDNGRLTKTATPANDNQWFRLRFYNSVQKDEIENRRRALQNMQAPPR
jgi:hypothetical protein